MSQQLAISVTASVLMMALFVLFGADVASVPLGQGFEASPVTISAPGIDLPAPRFLPISR
jgi:hypothetical protein